MNQKRKDQILKASATLFRKKGYQATSLKDIAAEIGIEAPSLYNHIESKQEILSSLLLELAEAFVQGIKDIDRSSLKGIEKLEKLIGHYIQLCLSHPDAISLITGEWVHLNTEERKTYIVLRDEYEKKFRKIFRLAKREGDIQEVNEDLAVFSILSTLRWLYSWISKNKNTSPVELEKQLIHILLDGIRHK